MDCAHVQRELELYALDGVDEHTAAGIREHLARCPACREAERDCRRLIRRIRRDESPALPRLAFARSLRESVRGEIRRIRRRRAVRRTMAGAATAACVLIAFALWPSGPSPSPDPAALTPAVLQLWRKDHARAIPMSTADAFLHQGANLYVLLEGGSRQAHLAALDPASGEQKWRSDQPSRGHLAADAARVYCLMPAGRWRLDLVALAAADGAELWRVPQDGSRPLRAPCRPVVLDGGRLCWTTAASVHMIRADDGQILWTRPIPEEGLVSAAASIGGRIVVASAKTLYDLDAGTGRIVRRLPLAGSGASRSRPLLATAGERAFVLLRTATDGRLTCLDLRSPRPIWTRKVQTVYHLLAADGALYVRGADLVEALDPATGRPLWRHVGSGCGPVTLADGVLYCIDSAEGGQLVALNGRSGATEWALDGYASCNAFVKAGGRGYLKTRDGVVLAMSFRS